MINRKALLRMATAAVALVGASGAMAASDTLKTTPVNDNYNNTANWVGGNVPGSGDTADFNNINANGVDLSPIYFTKFTADTTVGTFNINAPGTQHIILLDAGFDLTFTGGNGVLVNLNNTTSQLPSFNVADGSFLTFNAGSASAVTGPGRVTYNISGEMVLNNAATAGNAGIQVGADTGELRLNGTSTLGAALVLNNHHIHFDDSATAGTAAITNNWTMFFRDSSTAGSSTITNNRLAIFEDSATAGASVITMGAGSTINFRDTAEGGTARIILNGSGSELVDLTQLTDAVFNIGSIEGGTSADIVRIDDSTDTYIGGNDFTATGGIVTLNALIEGGETGEFRKVGAGDLILANNSNTFSADVVIAGGKLTVSGNGALGNVSNDVTFFNGATLRNTAAFTTARTFFVDDGGGTFQTDADLTVTGDIGDGGEVGALNKSGDASLILVGPKTYSGATNILRGALQLGDGVTNGTIDNTTGVAISGGATLAFNPGSAQTFSKNITGAGGVRKFGSIQDLILNGTNTYSGPTTIETGLLRAQGGSAIGNNSVVDVFAPAILRVEAAETIGALQGSGGVYVDGLLTLSGGGLSSSDTITFTGQINDGIAVPTPASILKQGQYTQIFGTEGSPVSQAYTGDTTVDGGTLIVNGSLSSNVFVNSGATFGGNVTTIGANLTNSSGNVSPGNSPGTMDIGGDYIGIGAPTYTVDIITQNQDSPDNGVTHDRLEFVNYVGANTQLLLNPTGVPVPTTGNGLEIVTALETSSSDDFFLSTASQTAQNGFYDGFQYVVNYVPGADNRFFLQTVVREELVANATALAASRQIGRDCFRGGVAPAAGDKAGDGRGWVNIKAGSFNSDASNGAEYDSSYNCVSGGVDLPVGKGFSVGLRGGYANSDTDLTVPQGLAQMDSVSWNAEAAVTYINGGFYAALTGGWMAHDWDYDHALASGNSSSETFDGVVGSLVGGYRAPVGKDSNLTFEGLVSYDSTDCGNNCFLIGTQEDTSDWEGRILGRFDTKMGSVRPYAQLSLASDFGNGQRVVFGNAISDVDVASLLLGANLGIAANLGGNWTGAFELGTTQGLDSDVDGYQGMLGIKNNW